MIGSEDRLAAYGAEFSGPRGYLDFARYGPPSEAVLAATAEVMDQAAHGEPTELLEEWTTAALAAVSRLSGFGVEQHAFVPNTSSGIFGLASGLPGAVVLVSPGEFPANLHPWWRAAEAGLIEVVTLTDPRHPRPVTPELVASRLAAADHPVTAVVVSAVDYRTGFRADLPGTREAIGDRLLLVDAIQAFGVVAQDWTVADAVVSGGQKWLRSGWGTGFLACSPRLLEQARPLFSGWTGVDRPGSMAGTPQPHRADAGRFTVSRESPFAAAALAAGVELVERTGAGAIATRIEQLIDGLLSDLQAAGLEVVSPVDPGDRAGIVVVRAADAPVRHHRALAAGLRTTLHAPDRIRISVHADTEASVLGELVDRIG